MTTKGSPRRALLLEEASGRLPAAVEHADASDDTLERLRLPQSSLKVSAPVRTSVLRRIGEAIDAQGTVEDFQR